MRRIDSASDGDVPRVALVGVHGGVTVAGVAGAVDLASAPTFTTVLRDAVSAAAGGRVVVDLDRVSFLGACGLTALLVVAGDARRRGDEMTVVVDDLAPAGVALRLLPPDHGLTVRSGLPAALCAAPAPVVRNTAPLPAADESVTALSNHRYRTRKRLPTLVTAPDPGRDVAARTDNPRPPGYPRGGPVGPRRPSLAAAEADPQHLADLLAPFVAWLATQDLDEAQRRQHRSVVERFLRWSYTDDGSVHDRRRRYERYLDQHDPDQLDAARASLTWWSDHRLLIAQTLPHDR